MASSTSTTKAPCAACGGKGVGVFKCEGCSQLFCRKHANEHRDSLNHQLDEIVHEHDALQHTINEQKGQQIRRHPSMIQIDEWERESIAKIQRQAEKARQELIQSINSQTESVSQQLQLLAEQLRKGREDDDFVETDLRTWRHKLKKLEQYLTDVRPAINIPEDSLAVPLNETLRISKLSLFDEVFERYWGDIQIQDNGRVARHGSSGESSAYVYGAGHYSSGQHRIRFKISKTSVMYGATFGIVSEQISMTPQSSKPSSFTYTWSTRDEILSTRKCSLKEKSIQTHMDGKISLEIELLLDCDNQKISYVNMETGSTRELNVNMKECPFPWQFQCYLYHIDDCVQLLSSHHSE